jgi:hypothetical protein
MAKWDGWGMRVGGECEENSQGLLTLLRGLTWVKTSEGCCGEGWLWWRMMWWRVLWNLWWRWYSEAYSKAGEGCCFKGMICWRIMWQKLMWRRVVWHGMPLWRTEELVLPDILLNLFYTIWQDSHALTLKNCTAKYYEVRKIWYLAYLTNFLSSIVENCSHVYIVFNCYTMSVFCKHSLNVWQISHHLS